MNRLFRTFSNATHVLLFACVVLMMSGCAARSSGSGSGEGGFSESDLTAMREARFGEGEIPLAEGSGLFQDVRFGFDSAQIDFQAQRIVEQNAEILRRNPNLRVTLEGHCDERGTADYNMVLGANRARAVFEMLVSLGIPSSRLDTISYGEEIPLDPRSNEEAWATNRRVHFSPHGAGTR